MLQFTKQKVNNNMANFYSFFKLYLIFFGFEHDKASSFIL